MNALEKTHESTTASMTNFYTLRIRESVRSPDDLRVGGVVRGDKVEAGHDTEEAAGARRRDHLDVPHGGGLRHAVRGRRNGAGTVGSYKHRQKLQIGKPYRSRARRFCVTKALSSRACETSGLKYILSRLSAPMK